MIEYAVKAETREGNVLTLRRGFTSLEAAEDYPVTLSLWKRVFVEEFVPPEHGKTKLGRPPAKHKLTPDQAFEILERAAIAGQRCPTADDGMTPSIVTPLARAGRIFVEVSTHNWRRVTILTGPHAGKATAPNPMKKCSTYLTIDRNGTRRNGRLIDSGQAQRAQPSLAKCIEEQERQ